jgi:hypothetical protein
MYIIFIRGVKEQKCCSEGYRKYAPYASILEGVASVGIEAGARILASMSYEKLRTTLL